MKQKKIYLVETWHVDRDGHTHDRLVSAFATKADAVVYLKKRHDDLMADLEEECWEGYYEDDSDEESIEIAYNNGEFDRGEIIETEVFSAIARQWRKNRGGQENG